MMRSEANRKQFFLIITQADFLACSKDTCNTHEYSLL